MAAAMAEDKNAYNYTNISFLHSSHSSSAEDLNESYKDDLVLVVLATTRGQDTPACVDIDTAACKLIAAQKPEFCSDPVLAKSACPKFCNLCPIQCYHCDATVLAVDACKTTKQCGEEEVCMRKELRSYMDGHHEYQLSCESKQHCDGSALTLSFGKRHVESRDLIISCCGSDLCNSATPQTTTASPQTTTVASNCRKDIIVLVDDGHVTSANSHWINMFLSHMVDNMDIGPNDALVSVVKFNSYIDVLWSLDAYTNKQSLEHAISTADFLSSNGRNADLDAALNYLIQHRSVTGNRINAEDVVIIITAHSLHWSLTDATLLQQVHSEYSDVFAHGIGSYATENDLRQLATDSSHVIPHHTGIRPGGSGSSSSQAAVMICR